MARKYDPDELEDTQIRLASKSAEKTLKDMGSSLDRHDMENEMKSNPVEYESHVGSKKRSAYRHLAKKYGQGYKDVHDKHARKPPTHKD